MPKAAPTLAKRRPSADARAFISRLRLSHLRLLDAIAEAGQLKKAAAELNVSPPAVSRQVKELEDALDQPILVRSGSAIAFTEVGKLLARHARQVLLQIERTRIEVERLSMGEAGNIGIGAVPTIAPFLLPNLVQHLREHSPCTAIALAEGRFDDLTPQLIDGTLDIAFVREVGHKLPESLSAQSVFSDHMVIACGPQHLLARRKQVHWKDLRDIPWLLPPENSSTFRNLERLLALHGLTIPEGSINSTSLAVNVGLMRLMPFLCGMSSAYLQRHLSSNQVHVLPLNTGAYHSEVRVVWRKDNTNPVLKQLIQSIEDCSIDL